MPFNADTVLLVDIPTKVLKQYAYDNDRGYRCFVVPATVVNEYGPPTVFSHLYQGCTRESMKSLAVHYAGLGTEFGTRKAKRLTEVVIPFLERYSLFGTDDDT